MRDVFVFLSIRRCVCYNRCKSSQLMVEFCKNLKNQPTVACKCTQIPDMLLVS
mgnify:CR=1 FL=1